jgi:hypothetical protein
VFQRPLLNLGLVFLLFDDGAAHVEHAGGLPLHNLAVFHHGHQVVSWKLYSLLSRKGEGVISTPDFVSSALSHAFHLVELQDVCLAGCFFIVGAHCCYYKSPIQLAFVNMNEIDGKFC